MYLPPYKHILEKNSLEPYVSFMWSLVHQKEIGTSNMDCWNFVNSNFELKNLTFG